MNSNEHLVKGNLIRKAIDRARRAIQTGFYLEAIVLCDSIISDRVSVIFHFSAESELRFRGVNDALRQLERMNIPILDPHLIAETLQWGSTRNQTIHGFSKLSEFEESGWRGRLKIASSCATVGLELALRWLAEARRHKI